MLKCSTTGYPASVAQASTPDQARPTRGRRSARPSGDDRERAILATAEELLAQRPLAEISIDDLAKGAGISRPTFYFYFRSKEAVLLTLLDQVVREADTAADAVFQAGTEITAQHWRKAINFYFETFNAHRAVAVACARATGVSPEVTELWSAVMTNWVRRSAEWIQAERDRGAAPPGAPAWDVALVLNLMNERSMFAVLADQQPALPEVDLVDTLLEVWLRTIYQGTPPPA